MNEDRIRKQLELEGFDPKSPQFDRALRVRKIRLCQEHRGVPSCHGCNYSFFCKLVEEHAKDLRRAADQRTRDG